MKCKFKINLKSMNIRMVSFIIICIIIVIFLILLCVCVNIRKNENLSVQEVREITDFSAFPEYIDNIPVITQLVSYEKLSRTNYKRKIKYIVIHETGNYAKGANAKNHAEYLSNKSTGYTAWHYTVDENIIYHHIPDNEVAYHAADRIGNKYGIGIELCVNKDGNFEITFENATKLVAYLIKEYDLTTSDIKTHNDFSGKYCPRNILDNNRMQEFIEKVEKLL